MDIFYSKSTRGFYNTSDHGAPTILIEDPAWVADLDDPDAMPPLVSVDNPDCKIPAGAVEISAQYHTELLEAESQGKLIQPDANGFPVAVDRPPLSSDEIEARKIKAAESAVQKMLDAKAKKKGYDNIINAATRAGYPGPYHDDGVAYATWMDACWEKCYEILNAVKAGTRVEPTIEEVIAEMPSLDLPGTDIS